MALNSAAPSAAPKRPLTLPETSKFRVSAHRFAHPLRPDRIVRAGEDHTVSYRDPSAAIDGAWPAG